MRRGARRSPNRVSRATGCRLEGSWGRERQLNRLLKQIDAMERWVRRI